MATIHDTIVQHYRDYYSRTRRPFEASYLAWTMRRSLERADLLLAVSESTRQHIEQVAHRFRLRSVRIAVTGEGSDLETHRLGPAAEKSGQVVHFASAQPHKQTLTLLRHWSALVDRGRILPHLRLIGAVDAIAGRYLARIPHATVDPFRSRPELVEILRRANALIYPSEIEGFGLPTLESYYCGTPVVFVKGTVAEELLAEDDVRRCGFQLNSVDDFERALDAALNLSPEAIARTSEDLFRRYNWRDVTQRTVDALATVQY